MLLRSFILAGIVLGIFLIMQLKARKKLPGDLLLIFWLAVISLQLLFYYDNLSPRPSAPQWMAVMGFALPLLSSPLLYLYMVAAELLPKKLWVHALPYLIYTAVLYCLPNRISDGFPHFGRVVEPWLANVLMAVVAVIPAFYALLTSVALWKLKRKLALSFALLFILLFLLIRFSVAQAWLSYQDLFAVVGSVLALYVFFIGYLGLRPDTRPRYQNSGLKAGTVEQLFTRLQSYMQEQQPFLDESLTLDTLAGQLAVSSNQLSQVINQHTSSGFLAYVNAYRVAAVKEKLKDPAYAHYSILAIAFDCGFGSKSTFNKIFKEMTGQTPSGYQRTGLSLPLRTTGTVN
jgi:AraC-like DNA-binding protein